MNASPHVVKIGGSLLSHPDARDAIGRWLTGSREEHPGEHQVLIVGGGAAVEWLRRLDRQHPLGAAAAHWGAIAMMDANAFAISEWWPEVALVDAWAALLKRVKQPGATLFATRAFLQGEESNLPGTRLRIGWQVTSDSIAARIAIILHGRLTVLKSSQFATPTTLAEWQCLTEQGAVDRFFPLLVPELAKVSLATV